MEEIELEEGRRRRKIEDDEDKEEEEEEEEDEDEDELKGYTTESDPNAKGGVKEEKRPLWDSFCVENKEQQSISMANTKFIDYCITVMKLLAYALTFSGVLFGGVFSKLIMLLMTSQLAPNKTVTVRRDNQYLELEIPQTEKYLWIWALFVSYVTPEIGTFMRSLRHLWFKGHTTDNIKAENVLTWLVTLSMETLHVLGLAVFVFAVLPNIDVVRGVMLTNCVCLLPGVLSAFSTGGTKKSAKRKLAFDVVAIILQLTGYFLWPVLDSSNKGIWYIPVALFLISFGWWMNFVADNPKIVALRILSEAKHRLKENDIVLYRVYFWVSLYKILIFGMASCGVLALQGVDIGNFFSEFYNTFNSSRTMTAYKLKPVEGNKFFFTASPDDPVFVDTIGGKVFWMVAVQILSSYLCYGFSKWSFKTMMSSVGFALPVIFVVPTAITLIIYASGLRNEDPGMFNSVLFSYVFFNGPPIYSPTKIFIDQAGLVWLLWLVSQTYITLHVWKPNCERLSRTEKLFATPMYSDFLIDQSILLNRRRDKLENKLRSNVMPHIIACATMWHESKQEMKEMVKSIMRMDMDKGARNQAKKNFDSNEETNCYEFDTHIFFDDAFEIENEESENMVLNTFVMDMIEVMDELNMMMPESPTKSGTPYGGRLTYTLPMGTKMYVHLKNKDKIRHRKRWSQVMYMYYLLGYNLMEKEKRSEEEKMIKANNLFLLALDGDIDFKPEAVLLLVDLMKKNPNVGAACGRIHPVGAGFMTWYQAFEYAIGHWLQKATEHMIGCVLCSPGCFSLFRGSALMAKSVMKTYTTKAEEARHYVQYDQGEDRWLCTLLLQRGFRVEYCAASDAYTHCPESFNEFYTQRRRWVPSTMANILDLLSDYKRIVKINNDISMIYIAYQLMLMIGTVLGPGTIFLLLVSAFNAAFKIDNWTSFYFNMIPILLYVVICLTTSGNIQLISALILSGIYGLIMMAVLVGMLMQISEDGFLAPSTIFLYIVAGEIIIAGIIHPQEFLCLLKGPIYYVTIPSMYLLLIIYSVCNLNVVVWGTREVKQKKTKAELEEEKKRAEEEKKKAQKAGGLHSILGSFGGKKKAEEQGSIEFSLGNIFKCMLFSHPKTESGTKELQKVNETLTAVTNKLENLERGMDVGIPYNRIQKSASKTSLDAMDSETADNAEKAVETAAQINVLEKKEERDDLMNPYWIENDCLKGFKLEVMDMNEIKFWNDLIEKYLKPILEDKEKKDKIAKELKELRDKMVTTFFMLNALFVTVVFLLQLNKSKVHMNWPLDAKINITLTPLNEISINKTHLELEPVGVLFIIFFAIILVVQFLAMLFHRFETLSHLLSSTPLRKKTTFEKTVEVGKKRLKQSMNNVKTQRNSKRAEPVDLPEMFDKVYSTMRHEEDMRMSQKEERRKSFIGKMKYIDIGKNKNRPSGYKTRLKEVTEEVEEL